MTFIHTPVMAQCVSDAPTTGLGSCIDFMAATSITATKQIKSLGYEIRYGQSNYTDHRETMIYIQSYDCNSSETTGLYARLSLLAHELGHAEYGAKKISARVPHVFSRFAMQRAMLYETIFEYVPKLLNAARTV